MAAVRFICSGAWLYRLSVVTKKDMSGLVARAAYISEPTIDRYRSLFAGLSLQFVLSRPTFGSIGDFASCAAFIQIHFSIASMYRPW